MESFEIILKVLSAIFIGGFAFIIIEIILDEYNRRRELKKKRERIFPSRKLTPEQIDFDSSTTAIPIKYTGGSTTETTEERRKRINREKMREYRAKKRASLAGRKTKRA